jgi:hypothetical protein
MSRHLVQRLETFDANATRSRHGLAHAAEKQGVPKARGSPPELRLHNACVAHCEGGPRRRGDAGRPQGISRRPGLGFWTRSVARG